MVKNLDYGLYHVLCQLVDLQAGMELAAFNRICRGIDFGRLISEALITVEDQHTVKITEAGRMAYEQFPILKMEENPQAKYHREPMT